MNIQFAKTGTRLGTRFAGAAIREEIKACFTESSKIIFDFASVESVNEPFADECYAKLIFDFEIEQIQDKIVFQNCSPFIEAVLSNTLKTRSLEAVFA